MGNACIKPRHDRKVFDPALISFKCLDRREISDNDQRSRYTLLVIMQYCGRQDYVQYPTNCMVDGHFDLSRMPATANTENQSPAYLGREYVHKGAVVLIAQTEQFGSCGIKTRNPPADVHRDYCGVERLKEPLRVFEHVNALAIEEGVLK